MTPAGRAVHEGPYAARWGDFATTGVLELHTLDGLPTGGAVVRLTSGSELAGPVYPRRLHRLLYYLRDTLLLGRSPPVRPRRDAPSGVSLP